MSLSGSVEDLPLLEILQVVSYCQKTGHLTVSTPAGDAAVVFDAGRIVAGYFWDVPPLPAGDPAPGPARERAVQQRVSGILERLVRLREGDFAFHLCGSVPVTLGGRDLANEMLPGGINPEELMLDLARKLDEDRREAAAVIEASFTTPLGALDPAREEPHASPSEEPPLEELFLEEAPGEQPAPAQPPREAPGEAGPAPEDGAALLLVDDEPDVCRVVSQQLEAAGFSVVTACDLSGARAAMERLAARRRPFLLVADVGLPSEVGPTFRGGLDVVRYAKGLASPPPVLLMSETIDEKLLSRAKRAGASLLAFKPGLSKLDPLQYAADLRAFGHKLATDLLPRLEGRRAARRRPTPQLVMMPSRDADARTRDEAIGAALAELQGHPDPDMVAFLLLRTAQACLARVVLFVVRDEELRGVAGSGPTAFGASLDLLARELVVPLSPASPFAEAVAFGRGWAGALPEDGPLRGLVARMGGLGATSAAVIPVRAQHETVAVLYGDAPGGAELPELDSLISFTEQAGRALDAALLRRRAPSELAC